MTKATKRIIGIAVELLLWGFFLIQEEFAFYGIYTLISYNVHEISTFIPYICLLATVVWLIVLIKRAVQKKTVKADKWFALLLMVFLVFQMNYFRNQSQSVSATMIATVESVDSRNGTITVTNADGDDKHTIVLEAPDLFRNMVEVGDRQYWLSYKMNKNNPNKGKLSAISLEKK